MSEIPAFVGNGRVDVLAATPLAQALYSPMFDHATWPVNHARFAFPDLCFRDLRRDWKAIATAIVAMLRAEAGRDPYDRTLTDLVSELCTRSESSGRAGPISAGSDLLPSGVCDRGRRRGRSAITRPLETGTTAGSTHVRRRSERTTGGRRTGDTHDIGVRVAAGVEGRRRTGSIRRSLRSPH
ncbi:MmyB family transcriptional regulator [Actinoplanes xinjiangensis]|uniref:MmyB family transcriptional regulator n=1 Tax=Actinoplanes xinjiangensis TaxID=512350 RepID=UPI003428DFA6